MSKLSTSVVIPCFNAGADVLATLRSLAEQTQPPDEIIVVDDGSTDDSAAVAQAFDSRIRVISQKNSGASVARFRGVQEATKDIVFFNDAGDVSYNSRIALLSGALEQHPLCVAAFAKTWVKPRLKPVICGRTGAPFDGSTHVIPDTLEECLAQSWPLAIGMNFAVRRDIALLSADVPKFYRAANDYAIQAFTACHGPFVYVSEITLEYAQTHSGISHNIGWMQQQAYALCAAKECYERERYTKPHLNDIFTRRVEAFWPAAALHAYLRNNTELRGQVMKIGLEYGRLHKVVKPLWWALVSAHDNGQLENAKILKQVTTCMRCVYRALGREGS